MILKGEKMAENKSLEELNRLKQDGQIDTATLDEENKKKVEEIADGKATIEKVEQFVSEGEVIAEAMQNQLYSNMVDPCASVGINITERLKKYFSENKVKPEDLSEEIQKQMINIRTSINRGVNALIFDARGNVDLRRSLQKAKNYGLPLPDYIENLAHDEEKKIVRDDDRRYEMPGLLNDEEKKIVREAIRISDEILESLKNDEEIKALEKDDVTEEHNGATIVKNDNIKNEYDAIVYSKLDEARKALDEFKNIDIEGMLNDEQDKHAVKLWAIYHSLGDINKIENEIVKRKAVRIMQAIEQRFRGLKQKNIQDVSLEELPKLTRFLNADEISEIVDKVEKRNEIIVESIENKRDRGVLNIEISDDDIARTYENQEYLILKYNILKRTINNQENDDINSTEHSKVLSSAKERGDSALISSDRRNHYDEFGMISYQQTMKRHVFEKVFENGGEIPEEYRTIDGKVLPNELMLLNYFVAFSRARIVEFGFDYEFAVQMRKNIAELFPGVKVTYDGQNVKKEDLMLGLNVKEIYNLYQEQFKDYVSFKSINDMLEFSNKCTDETFKIIIEESIERPDEDFVDIDAILDNEKFYEEVNDRKRRLENNELKRRLEYEVTKKGYELIEEANDPERYQYREKTIIDMMVMIVNWQSLDLGDGQTTQSLEDELVSKANNVLAKKFPNAFDGGRINLDKLEKEYEKYAKRFVLNPHLFNIERWIDEPGKSFIDSIRWNMRNEKISQNPEIAKARREEELLKKNFKMNQTKIAENQKMYEFILLYKKTRGIDIGGDTLEALNFMEENMIKKLKNLAVNILSDEQRDSMTDDEIKKYQEEFMSNFDIQNADIELFEQKIKTARTEYVKEDAMVLMKKPIAEYTDEDKKRLLSLYAGTKRDWEDRELNDKKKNTIRRMISSRIEKVFPGVLEDGVLNEERLINVFNEVYELDGIRQVTDINTLYSVEENRLIGEYFIAVGEDFKKYRGVANSELAQQIVDDSRARDEMIAANKKKNISFDISMAVGVIDGIQDATKANIKGELSGQEKIQYVKDLITIVGMFNGKEWDEDSQLSDIYMNYKKLSNNALYVAVESLAKIFPNIKDENGNLNFEILEEQYAAFVEKNNVELPEKFFSDETLILRTARERKQIEERKRKSVSERKSTVQLSKQIEDALEKTNQCIEGYEEEKNDDLYAKVYAILKKVSQIAEEPIIGRIILSNIKGLDKRKEIKDRAEKEYGDIEVSSSQIDAISMYASHRWLTQMHEKLKTNGIQILGDKMLMIQAAVGTLIRQDKITDSNLSKLVQDASQISKNVLRDLAPELLDENGDLIQEDLEQKYNERVGKYQKYTTREGRDLETVTKRGIFHAFCNLIKDERYKDTIDSKLLEVITMTEVVKDVSEIEITGNEAEQAFSANAVEIDVSAIDSLKRETAEEVVIPPITQAEAADAVVKKVEDIVVEDVVVDDVTVEENVEPKLEQQVDDKKVENIVAESMEVGDNEEKNTNNLPATIKKQNIFSKIFSSVKQKVGEVLGKFSNDTSTDTSDASGSNASSSSSGGIMVEEVKVDQTVQNSSMFGPQVDLDVKGAKEAADRSNGESTGEKVVEEK